MKYFNHIVVALLLVVCFSSCKKWLDVTPGNQVRTEDQFSSEPGFRDALMGVYISMTLSGSYGQHSTWGGIDYLAQPYNAVANTDFYYNIQLYRYKTTLGMQVVESIWKGNYNTIANVNSMLENLEKKKDAVHPISYSIMKGELLGLRAFLHFDLMRMFGRSNYAGRPELVSKPTIPYVTSFSKTVPPQRSYSETFALMEKDINEALQLLQEDPVFKKANRPANYFDEVNRTGFYSNRSMRMNYYAVRALQARLLLWEGSTAKVAEAAVAAEDVISNSEAKLIAADNPVKDVIMKSEFLFALNVDRFFELINPFLQLTAVGTNSISMSQDNFYNIYENNSGIGLSDFRQQEWFIDLGDVVRTRVPVKMRQIQNDLANRNRLPLMRLSEMYYIAAEARLTMDLPKSIQLLNTVRRSRGIVQDIPVNADLATVTGEITKEYRKDFVQEGQLFFYYKRKGFTSFPGLPTSVPGNDGIYMIPFPDSEMEFGNREQ